MKPSPWHSIRIRPPPASPKRNQNLRYKRITIFAALICGILLLGYFPTGLAASAAQSVGYLIYLPIVIKPVPVSSTPIPTGVQIQNYSHNIDGGYLYIFGEILNGTSNNLKYIKIAVNLFNIGGQLLDTDLTFTPLDNLPVGDRTCFSFFLPVPSGFDYYEFEPPSYSINSYPLTNNLTILNDSGSSSPGMYQIIGQIRNNSVSRVGYVRPVSTVYDVSGTVMGCRLTYVNSTSLDPGQTSSFKISYFTNADKVTSHRLQVDGNP